MLGLAEVDGALARLDADCADISANLVALESHAGTRFLDSAPLSGVSAARWTEAKAKIALIWSWFAAYRDVLDRAHLVRSRQSRPGAHELHELTELLQDNVITLGTADLPIEQRDLLGPLVTTTATSLPRLISDMTACFREVTTVIAVADSVGSVFLPELDKLDTRLRNVQTTLNGLGLAEIRHDLTGRVGRIADEVDRERGLALSDPLALDPDPARLHRLGDELTGITRELHELTEARDGLDERVRQVTASIARLEEAQTKAREAGATVRAKIRDHGVPEIVPVGAELRRELARASSAHWVTAAGALAAIEHAVSRALADAEASADTAEALLGRRNELRARLDAYRVKSARLRLNEDAAIGVLHERAYELLWTAPCDLPAATRALNAYQAAINDRGKVR